MIVGAARTPVGKFLGALQPLKAPDLGAVAIREALRRAGVRGDDVQEVIMGNVVQAGLGQAPARQAALKAGVPPGVSALTVNMVCGSGLRAVMLAAQAVRAGDARVVVAGGQESMSNAPYLNFGMRNGTKFGEQTLADAVQLDGLPAPWTGRHMYEQASEVATELDISRAEQDRWAHRSQERAIAAMDSGVFAEEIVPVTVPGRRGDTVVDVDEGPRRGSTLEAIAALRPLTPGGSHTAGNSPGINDGAAAVVVASDEEAAARGLEPLAIVRSVGYTADTPRRLARVPALAIGIALERAGLTVADVDRFEINEAFASVALNSSRMLGADEERVNVHGGAVALGHPIGASGALLVVTLVHELRRIGGGIGAVGICSGGGQGDAMILEVPAPA